MVLLFFICVFTFLYTFVGYPLTLKLLTRHKQKISIEATKSLPKISILLCIYNAADKLALRITNIMESEYPEHNIHIIIVSDGSLDNPKHVIDDLSFSNITLIEYEKNQGKAYALSQGLKEVKTELVAFADIRQTFHHEALKNLTHHFVDNSVGAVSGNLEIKNNLDNNENDPGLYWKYEKWIRQKESDLYSMLGVTGAIYMARHTLIPKIPKDTLLDDMYIPLTMVKSGYKIKFDNNAIAYDVSSSSTEEEFHRKVRTLAGNFQLMSQLPWLMSPRKNPLFFQFFSHKVMRLITPYCLLFILMSSYSIDNLVFQMLFITQVVFYGYSWLSYVLLKNNKKMPFASICISFCSLQFASLIAGWKYKFSSSQNLWKKH